MSNTKLINFTCEFCGRKASAPESLAGRNLKCGGCGKTTSIPVPSASPTPVASSVPATGFVPKANGPSYPAQTGPAAYPGGTAPYAAAPSAYPPLPASAPGQVAYPPAPVAYQQGPNSFAAAPAGYPIAQPYYPIPSPPPGPGYYPHPAVGYYPPHAVVVPKNRVVYVILGLFLGGLGIHNFYAGYTNNAVSQLLITLLAGWLIVPLFVIWIWVLVEVCTVTKDAQGIAFN